jgi:hypothetical protein
MTHKIDTLGCKFVKAVLREFSLLTLLALIALPNALKAQTAGEGTITGTVTDSTGAIIPNATVTATNTATNVSTTRTTSSAGAYTIAPLQPGTYSLQVAAKGFKTLTQENLDVVALGEFGFNPVLTLGEATDTVLVTAAPPVIDTTNATINLVMENQTYANLPLQMNNAQRDPTAFGVLAPGAQSGARLPIIGGTGNYLGQLYLDGMPAETISQQGDNRLVSEAVDLDAVDQFQVVTSTPPAEYSGAGSMNFTMKSGGLKYHGQISDFVRNTIFDSWAFTAKWVQIPGINPATGVAYPTCAAATNRIGCQGKPVEHQNELSLSIGGKVPRTGDKLFFFFAYDKFHERKGAVYSLYTVPTALMRAGDFTELNGNVGTGGLSGTTGTNATAYIYDPTTNNCVGTACTRAPFQGSKNGVPTYNVIPTGYLSTIALNNQQFLPAPSNPTAITSNYLGGWPSGYDNHVINYRVDYDLSAKQRISTLGALGTVDYLNNYGTGGNGATAYGFLPPPYIGGDLASIFPKVLNVEDAYVVNDRMTNQLKYGFTRFYQDIKDATQGVSTWEESTLGVTNLPTGQAGEEFFGATFAAAGGVSTSLTQWRGPSGSVSTQLTTPNTYTLVDNFIWTKQKHSLTFGIAYQWEQINNANPSTFTGGLDLNYNAYSTANYTAGSSALSSTSGYSYASFLLGAVGGTPSLPLQYVAEEGGRYRPVSPYVEDNWKITPKLTADIGIRWDYFPPFHEVKDHWTFLNPNLTNSATNTPGELQFAGNYGGAGVSCGCRTPVNTYWKNWGPRVGLAYSVDNQTVVRVGFGEVFSQAGGVGGRGGAFNGTGQTGFNVTATGPSEVTSGALAGPSFFLNNGTYFTGIGKANTLLFGSTSAYPAAPTPSAASQILNSGNYLNGSGALVTAAGVSYADPYLSGRAPEFNFYNVGIERGITKDMTLAVNYVGDQSHFLVNSTSSGGNARGYWAGQLDPKYLAGLGNVFDSTGKKPILTSPATAANVAIAQTAMPGLTIPAFIQAAAAVSTTVTIAQGLLAFPQYGNISGSVTGVTDTWGQNVGNFSYHSLQITLLQRPSHGLSFNINYTYSKNVGDDGSFRSGYNIPAGALSNGAGAAGSQTWQQDRIERSWTTVSAPESLHIFSVYELPFGKGHIGNNSFWVRQLSSGWQLSTIYTYASGTPIAVTYNGCTVSNNPGEGQCMPDLNIASPDYTSHNARINGSYGTGPNGTIFANLGSSGYPYIDAGAFSAPAKTSTGLFLLGNAPRTRPLNLNNPGSQDIDAALRRSFPLPRDFGTLVFEADCLNAWNKVQFGGPGASFGSATFGTISGVSNSPRDWQFAGHINF